MVYATTLLFGYTKLNAQITKLDNIATVGTEYCGWDGSGSFSKNLDLKNFFPGKYITFTTTTSGSTTSQRVLIDEVGNVAIGANFSSPTSKLHMHNNGAVDNWFQISTVGSISSGSIAATDGLRIGIINSTQEVQINQQEAAPMNFLTSGTQRMQIASGGNVGIGDVAQSTDKLYLKNDYSVSSADNCLDILSTNTGGGIKGINTGVTGSASSPYAATGSYTVVNNGYYNTGIYSKANNGVNQNYGGYLYALGNTTNTISNVGVYGVSENGTNGYGGFFSAAGASSVNIGVFATASNTGAVAAQFSGNCEATAFITTSDSIFKTNVVSLNNGLAIINLLQPKTYDFLNAQYPGMNLPNGNHAGLIAQDLEQVLPNLVFTLKQPEITDQQGNVTSPAVVFKGVNYIELIPYLIDAIKEQQLQIQALQSGAKSTGSINPLEIKLSDKSIVVLEQNQPNPFRDKTSINYNIPADANTAQILFYNSKGNVISTVEITQKGAGSLLVYGADLTNGIYTYTLLVNDKVVETKKMMKVK